MNRYGKLVVMELHRFWKIYAALAAVTVVSQIGGMIYGLGNIMGRVNRIMTLNGIGTYADYAASPYRNEEFRSAVGAAQPWLTGPVFLCIAALAGYCFFIWYRDWAGKSTFAYRLLMLPTSRMNLFWSKLTAIMLFVLGLIALQLVLLPVLIGLYGWRIPPELFTPETVHAFIAHDRIFRTLIPSTFTGFLVSYGAGMLGVIIVFTAILIERSYRLIGIAMGIAYASLSAIALLAPRFIASFESEIALYPMEIFRLQLGIGLFLLGLSLALSAYLITRRITV